MEPVMRGADTLIQTALLGEAVDASPALVFVADEEMRYLAVNRRACEVLGYTRDELLRLTVPDVAREAESPAQYDEMLARGFHSGVALLTRKDGTIVVFYYRASKTRAAKLELFVSVGFVAEDDETGS
jgi:PAS domain S-box-containing protein